MIVIQSPNKISSDYFMKKVKKQAETIQKTEEKIEEIKQEQQPTTEKQPEESKL